MLDQICHAGLTFKFKILIQHRPMLLDLQNVGRNTELEWFESFTKHCAFISINIIAVYIRHYISINICSVSSQSMRIKDRIMKHSLYIFG
jgi:hypothetical protein